MQVSISAWSPSWVPAKCCVTWLAPWKMSLPGTRFPFSSSSTAYTHSMSVVRPQRAINAGVLVPPSSFDQMTEWVSTVCPGVAAGADSCHATSGESVNAKVPPYDGRLRP
ncbi:MAG: hypothetical protein ACR2F6_16480 [Mycobacteriales bacterium]